MERPRKKENGFEGLMKRTIAAKREMNKPKLVNNSRWSSKTLRPANATFEPKEQHAQQLLPRTRKGRNLDRAILCAEKTPIEQRKIRKSAENISKKQCGDRTRRK